MLHLVQAKYNKYLIEITMSIFLHVGALYVQVPLILCFYVSNRLRVH